MTEGLIYEANKTKLAGRWAYNAVWKRSDEQTGGLIHVPPEYFGFIRLFERYRKVSVYVNDIERLAQVCEEQLNKKLVWECGSLLYFYHLKLVDIQGKPKAVDYESVVGGELCRLSKLKNHIISI